MSLSTNSYSKASRSSSYYSRSSSYHASTNNNYNSSYCHRSFSDDQPLSTRLIERDYSYPSLTWNWDFDDPFLFDRMRWHFDNELLKLRHGLGRRIPISYERWTSSLSRNIPIQYIPSTSNRRHQLYKKLDHSADSTSSLSKRHDESSMMRENRLASNDWPPMQDVDQQEVPYYRQTPATPTYAQSARTDYY